MPELQVLKVMHALRVLLGLKAKEDSLCLAAMRS
jgi:hypothetical protein